MNQIQMTTWQDKYQRLEEIGSGSSGKIYKVMSLQRREVMAAKVIPLQGQDCDLQSIEQEIQIMSSCSHINVLKCLGVELYPSEIWILLELCQGRSLADIMRERLGSFSQEQISTILRQVLEGLCYLHKRGIVHRDIKASNLLYHRGVVKIADFGISILSPNASDAKFCRFGSPYWMSPEILSQSLYSEKADIWALGITSIELAEAEPPYSHQHPFRAIYSIQTHPPQSLTKPETCSKAFNNFVRSCLNVDHRARPTAQFLAQHQFICPSANGIELSLVESQEGQNTIIMHEDIPKSIWEKSYPQSSQKDKQFNYSATDTVIIKEDPQQQEDSTLKLMMQNSIFYQQSIKHSQTKLEMKAISLQQRQRKVKELFLCMQEEVKQVRRKYLTQIKSLYLSNLPHESSKQNKAWNSPVKKLKQKNREATRHSKACSDLSKVIF